MKKALVLLVSLFVIAAVASCVVVRPKPYPKKVAVLKTGQGKWVVIKKRPGVTKVKVWRHHKKKGHKPFKTVVIGAKVRVIKIDGPNALVEFENGDTGWIEAVFVK